jgi:hypothetical protein
MKNSEMVFTWHHGRASKCVIQDESRVSNHIFKIITSRGTRMNKGMQRFNEKYFLKEMHLHSAEIIARNSSRVIS